MVLGRRDGLGVGASLGWPSSLGDDDGLALVGELALQVGDLGGQEGTGLRCSDVAIEEWVRVDGAVVGFVAEFWVSDCCDESIDSDDWSSVTGGLEKSSSGIHGGNDGGWGSSSGVDKLVTDGDGVEA